MPDAYKRAVDELLAAIRLHLRHQHEQEPTEQAIAAYIRRSDPATIRDDLQHYPECQSAARYLNQGRTNTTHVLYVMLWGRVDDWPPADRGVAEDQSDPQHGNTLLSH